MKLFVIKNLNSVLTTTVSRFACVKVRLFGRYQAVAKGVCVDVREGGAGLAHRPRRQLPPHRRRTLCLTPVLPA